MNTFYDALGRTTSTAETVTPYATTSYAYLAGNITKVTDPSSAHVSTTQSAYGTPDNGDPVLIADDLGATTALTYGYDVGGKLKSEKDPSSTTYNLAPDGFGRPTEVATSATNYITGVTYNPNDLVAGANFLNGQVLSETLTARQLPLELKVAKSGGPTAMDLTYGYTDPRRVITGITDAVISSNTRAYTYDVNSRLLTASGPWGSGSYSYDALDNLRQTVLGSCTAASSYDAPTNRVSAVSFTGTSCTGSARTYSYDANGNTSSDGIRTLTHDAADQPVTISEGSNSATFTYDGNFKRVKEVEGSDTVYTLYSHASSLVYRDDATTSNHTVYIGIGPAELRIVNSTTPTYVHLDTQGSAVAATDSTGAVSWTEQYTPFGDTLLNPTANANNKGYTGYLRDTDFALNYAEARYYDPVIGRFLEADPKREANQISLYAYVGNNPINKTDPTGEDPSLRCFACDPKPELTQNITTYLNSSGPQPSPSTNNSQSDSLTKILGTTSTLADVTNASAATYIATASKDSQAAAAAIKGVDKVLGPLALGLNAAAELSRAGNEMSNGMAPDIAIAGAAGRFGTSTSVSLAGAFIGGAVGTAIEPGGGTAAGAVVGGVVGGEIADKLGITEAAGQKAQQAAPSVEQFLKDTSDMHLTPAHSPY